LAGTAFLPWEKWFTWLVHKLAVAIRRRSHRIQRQQSLSRSKSWPQLEGTVEGINCDISNPREKSFIPIPHRRGIAPGLFGIGLTPLRPDTYESEIESSYASTRQMTKSLYFFNSLDDW
jgi:hypothetical protein